MLVASRNLVPAGGLGRPGSRPRRDGSGERLAPRIRVLIVEDDADVRAMLSRALRGHCEIVGMEDTVEAVLALPEATATDVILYDLVLRHGENAFLRLPEVRHRFPTARIVVCTGNPDLAPVEEALEAGVSGYIVKYEIDHVSQLCVAVAEVHAGRFWLSRTPAAALELLLVSGAVPKVEPLTDPALRLVPLQHPDREKLLTLREVLVRSPVRLQMAVGVRHGLTYGQIASRRGCTLEAVHRGMQRLFGQTGIHGKLQLALLMIMLVG